jgi:hypothetical protein
MACTIALRASVGACRAQTSISAYSMVHALRLGRRNRCRSVQEQPSFLRPWLLGWSVGAVPHGLARKQPAASSREQSSFGHLASPCQCGLSGCDIGV